VDLEFEGIVSNLPVTAVFKVVSSNYLDTTFYEYYYPEKYIPNNNYEVLPNGISNGFRSIYSPNGESIGNYDPGDTIREYDPHKININTRGSAIYNVSNLMAPQ
jgi:hypothetical protein